MDDSPLVRLGLRLWPVRCFLLAHRSRRTVVALALPLLLVICLPLPRQPVATDFSVRSFTLPGWPILNGVAIDPSLGRVFFTDGGGVWVFDEAGERLLGRMDVVTQGADSPSGAMAVDTGRHRLYLAPMTGKLAMLDGRTGLPTRLWPLGPTFGLALDGVADRVLVPQPIEKDLVALDATRQQVVAKVTLADPPEGVAVDGPDRRVYVAAVGAERLDILDADTYRLLATVALDGPAGALAVDPATHRVFAADPLTDVVSVVDGRSGAILARPRVGPSPVALALNPATGHLFVADAGDDTLTVLDTRRDAVVATVPVAGQPVGVAADPRTNRVYVAGGAGGAAWVLQDQRRPPALLAAIVAHLWARLARPSIGGA